METTSNKDQLFCPLHQDSIGGIRINNSGRIKGQAITAETIGNYYTIKTYLSEFVNLKNKSLKPGMKKYELNLDNIDMAFYHEFTELLYSKNHFDFYDNYVGKIISIFKAFCAYCFDTLEIKFKSIYKKFPTPYEEPNIDIIDFEQINTVIDFKLDASQIPESIYDYYKLEAPKMISHNKHEFNTYVFDTLKATQDLFIFGFSTAIRISDLLALTEHKNIKKFNKKIFMEYVSKKTSTPVAVSLIDFHKEIMDYNKEKYGRILPKMTDQDFNKNLKQLAKLLNWDIPVRKIKSKRGVPYEIFKDPATKEQFKFHEVISSKIMRAIGITSLLIVGLPEYEVKLISGHSKDSRAFRRYVHIADKYVKQGFEQGWLAIRKTAQNEINQLHKIAA